MIREQNPDSLIYAGFFGWSKGVARGEGGKSPPPQIEKIVVENGLFPKALFLVTNFRKK